MISLSEHFTLDEFTKSITAERLGIKNVAPPSAVDNLRILCTSILEPLRQVCGRPLVINSGYRSSALNLAVGGSVTSAHLEGRAADIRCNGSAYASMLKLFLKSLDKKLHLNVDECFLEQNLKSGFVWLHVSWSHCPRHLYKYTRA